MKTVPDKSLQTYILGMALFLAAAPCTRGQTTPGLGSQSRPAVGIFKADLPQTDPAVADHLKAALEEAGFSAAFVDTEQAANADMLTTERFTMLIVPNARSYPAEAFEALAAYLNSGGHLVTIGGPAFARPARRINGRWSDDDMIRQAVQRIKPDRIVLPFDDPEELKGWHRAANDPKVPGALRLVKDAQAAGGACLAIHTDNLTNWDTWYSPPIDRLFASGHALLCLRARADAATPQMAVEIRETDGSRWFAVVELSEKWQNHVLQPSDFKYWPDSSTVGKRGGAGDCVKPQNANVINFGLARSHTSAVHPGPHTFYVDAVGTAADPFADFARRAVEPPVIETISPAYKVYELSNVAAVKVEPDQKIITRPLDLPVPRSALSPHMRFAGRGFTNSAKWRFIPLLEAFDKDNHKIGVPFSLLVSNADPCKGSVLANLAINDADSIKNSGFTTALIAAMKRIKQGLFLLDAGAQNFASRTRENVVLGTHIINTSPSAQSGSIRITVSQSGGGTVLFTRTARLTPAPREVAEFKCDWQPPSAGTYAVRTELLCDGRPCDEITHGLTILPELQSAAADFISVRNGDFWLKGRKWYPVGVNYWPMYVAGLEPGDYWLHWLAPGAYDPHEVEKDLALMQRMGVNMVSIQTGKPEHLPNLLDFLHRCGRREIKVNAFIENASPLGFREDRVRDYIRAGRLDQNPVIFAWDTIWEPGNYVFSESWRPRWDNDWRHWIVERYGSIENAEKDWRFAAPQNEGRITSPTDMQLREDGPWRIMVAAYRRFMDDLMSRKWNDATRALRAIVPNQLISFRQGNTLPHDFTFTATAKHIDFICPEGYAIPNTEDGRNAAAFITRYVRFTTGGKPIIWSEFGKSVWNADAMRPDPQVIAEQGRYHDIFYRVVLAAGAQGTAPWWWPGGYRVDEKSDYGIMNPDGTPRPAARLLAEYAPQIKTPRDYPAGTIPFVVDRDAHPGGYWYVAFNTGKDACAAAAAKGANIDIRTPSTGTTSVDTPLVALGNTACNGANPPKYLNAEFNYFRVLDAAGRWVDVRTGDNVRVTSGQPIRAAASVGNLHDATWLTPKPAAGRPGAVYLASTERSQLGFRRPIPKDTPRLHDVDFRNFLLGVIDKETAVEIQMTAAGRAAFGEKIAFTLQPE